MRRARWRSSCPRKVPRACARQRGARATPYADGCRHDPQRRPATAAGVDAGVRWSYEELEQRTSDLAAELTQARYARARTRTAERPRGCSWLLAAVECH